MTKSPSDAAQPDLEPRYVVEVKYLVPDLWTLRADLLKALLDRILEEGLEREGYHKLLSFKTRPLRKGLRSNADN